MKRSYKFKNIFYKHWKKIIILLAVLLLGGLMLIYKSAYPPTTKIDAFMSLVLANQEYNLTKEELIQYKSEIQTVEVDKNHTDLVQKQYFFLGYIEGMLGNDEESKAYYKSAYQLGGNSDPVTQTLMLSAKTKSYLQIGEKEIAHQIFQENIASARQISEDIVAKVYQAYARNRVIYNNEIGEAIRLMQEAMTIKSSPETSAYNHLYLSLLYLATNNYTGSIQESISALEICKENQLEELKGASVKSLGDIYYVQRKYNQAISIYEELLKGNYKVNLLDELTYLAYLADCYAMINKFDLAQEMIERCKILTNKLGKREALKELNWIYLLKAKVDIFQSDVVSAKESLKVAKMYYNRQPEEAYANIDIWEQQLTLDSVLFEKKVDVSLLDAYIDLLENMKARGIKDDLYHTIRDRIIYVGDHLGEDALTNVYRQEKIEELERNEEVNYDASIGNIIETLHDEKSLKIILSWKMLAVIAGGIALFILGNAIHIHRAHRKIKKLNGVLYEQSITDYLTKVYNKKYLYEYMKRNHQSQLICMLIDIDYFKLYNDTYGHVAGDKVLEQVAGLLKKVFTKDEVFRYGGEEFCIVSTTEIDVFEENIKRLYVELNRLQIKHEASKIEDYLTISGGVYCGELGQEADIERFLRQADKKLYQAKALGRNQFVI